MQKKITIIGGSGFVGTNLCRLLSSKQYDFEIIDLKMSKEFSEKCKIGDVRDFDSLCSTITGNVVLNLAALHRDDVRDTKEYHATNVIGAENVAKACVELGIKKIVFTSSVAVYGFAESGTDERGAIEPFNEYGQTKFDAEDRLREWHSEGERELIIVRPTVIFGEGNRGNVYNLLNQIASRKFLMVGNGKNKKSMAYIGNIVSFLEACIKSNKTYGIYNYTDSPDLSMDDLVSQVRKALRKKEGVGFRLPYWVGLVVGYVADLVSLLTGRKLPVSSIRVRKFTSSTSFRSAKADLDNFAPPFSLSEGLSRTIMSEFILPDPKREIFFTE
jgi:nucleoside-diphosphate-sugar epimerase